MLILARVDHEIEKAEASVKENCFIYFWYDRDCSDSCIGRFKTTDLEEDVIASFSAYCTSKETNNEGQEEAKEIPLHYFDGVWITD